MLFPPSPPPTSACCCCWRTAAAACCAARMRSGCRCRGQGGWAGRGLGGRVDAQGQLVPTAAGAGGGQVSAHSLRGCSTSCCGLPHSFTSSLTHRRAWRRATRAPAGPSRRLEWGRTARRAARAMLRQRPASAGTCWVRYVIWFVCPPAGCALPLGRAVLMTPACCSLLSRGSAPA